MLIYAMICNGVVKCDFSLPIFTLKFRYFFFGVPSNYPLIVKVTPKSLSNGLLGDKFCGKIDVFKVFLLNLPQNLLLLKYGKQY